MMLKKSLVRSILFNCLLTQSKSSVIVFCEVNELPVERLGDSEDPCLVEQLLEGALTFSSVLDTMTVLATVRPHKSLLLDPLQSSRALVIQH